MWAIDYDPDDSFPEGDPYTYAGPYTSENTCQERRPGALHTWSLTTIPLMGKVAGADLKDCGGLCCDPAPKTARKACMETNTLEFLVFAKSTTNG